MKHSNITRDEFLDLCNGEMSGLERFKLIRKFFPDKRTSYEQIKFFVNSKFDLLRATAQLDKLTEVQLGYFLCIRDIIELIDAIDYHRTINAYYGEKGS